MFKFNNFLSQTQIGADRQMDCQKQKRNNSSDVKTSSWTKLCSLKPKPPSWLMLKVGRKGGLKEEEEEELHVMTSANAPLWCSMRNKWADFAKRAASNGHEVRVSLWSSAFTGREPPSLGFFRRTGLMRGIHSWFLLLWFDNYDYQKH